MEKIKNNIINLDEEEKEISKAIDVAIDKGILKSINNLEEELDFAKKAASNYLRKNTRVTLRLSDNDLELLKQKAAYKGHYSKD